MSPWKRLQSKFSVLVNLTAIRNLHKCSEYKYYRSNCVCVCVLNESIYGTILENLTSWYKSTPSPHSTGIHHWWLVLVKMETHQLLVIWPCPDSLYYKASMISIPGRFLFPSLGNWYRLHCLFQPCDSDIRWR